MGGHYLEPKVYTSAEVSWQYLLSLFYVNIIVYMYLYIDACAYVFSPI